MKSFLVAALAVAAFICLISARLYQYSTYSLAFGNGPEPASFSQLFRYAAYLEAPPSLDACINRLRQIDGAKQQWALEHDETNNVSISWHDIEPYLGRGSTNGLRLWCPAGGPYKLGRLLENPTCSVKGHVLP